MNLKNSKVFKFVSVSDIHLGNKRNTSEDIIKNLNQYLTNSSVMRELDLIVFVGDVFDTLLSSIDVLPIDVWISRTLALAKEHDVAIRVLEGTPSHDWKQSRRFEYVNEHVANIGADLRYIKDLSIWYEEKFDMNFLFVPDEWSTTTDQTLHQVQDMMKAKGLETVDYAFMHGNFEYQLPSHLNIPKHDSQSYLKLVKHLIFIGHIHTYSNLDRIYAQGSFDRMSHGEEEAKGYLLVEAFDDGHHDVKFIVNEQAKKFLTIDCTGLDLEQTIAKAMEVSQTLPHGSHARLRAEYQNPVFTNMDELIRSVPHCTWTKDPKDKSNDKKREIEEESFYIPVEITPDNVKSLINDRLNLLPLDDTIRGRVDHYLNEMLGAGV